MKCLSLSFLFCLCISLPSFSQDTIYVSSNPSLPIGNKAGVFVDSLNQFSGVHLPSKENFKTSTAKVPTYLLKNNNIWLKLIIKNNSSGTDFFLTVPYPNIPELEFFSKDSTGILQLQSNTGSKYKFNNRTVDDANFVFKIHAAPNSINEYYLHVKSDKPLQLPIFLKAPDEYRKTSIQETLIIGLYAGIIIAILFYNLFLFFSTKDTSYLLYVIYLFCLLLAQLTFSGWMFKFLWPNSPSLNQYAVIVTSSLPGITGLLFSLKFLHVKRYSKILWYAYLVAAAFYSFVFLFGAALPAATGYALLNFSGIGGGLLLIVSSGYIAFKKRYRPAYYYFIAWFLFALGRQVHSLRNLDVVPYNLFTNYILYIGSALEAILLSLALADRINLLQREKDFSQKEMLKVLEENSLLIKEQNIVLEGKVAERTSELTSTNNQLNQTLTDLQDAQIQLVEAEKMASLGQLTAGIAHEINNPINFVKSNIKPLQLDIKDLMEVIDEYEKLHTADADNIQQQLSSIDKLKKQIDVGYVRTEIVSLMKGIEDGAERTAEIVRGLRTFSRLDESEVKSVNIHEGIDSTLVLLRNTLPDSVTIEKDFQAEGNIECFPGKLNQVFMNIISNGIQAIKENGESDAKITITTKDVGNMIEIRIKDTGMGMTEDVKHKIFDPFFTTKDVGEGTGLGLSIVFKIIQKHQGKIDVASSPGNGAEFILTLFHTLPESAIT